MLVSKSNERCAAVEADSDERVRLPFAHFEDSELFDRPGTPFWMPGRDLGAAWTRGYLNLAAVPGNTAIPGSLSSVVTGRRGIQKGWGMRAIELETRTEARKLRQVLAP